MNMLLRIQNYRCFSDDPVTEIVLKPGFMALVGVNNSGKSSLLKLFRDFKPIFRELAGNSGNFWTAFRGAEASFNQVPSVLDCNEMAFQGNSGDIRLEVSIEDESLTATSVTSIQIVVKRGTTNWKVQFSNSNGPLDANDGWRLEGTRVILNDGRVMGDFAATFKAFHILANAFYIPAFRHVTSYAPEDNREYVGNHFEFRNGKVFIDFWGSAQSGNLISNRKKASSLVTEIANIFGYQGFEIKDAKDGRAMLVTIDGLPFRLDDVGTGLAQTIIMVANATYAEPTLLLIDEPELNLHPSLQTKLMNLLGTIASFGVVFATHSLGLARSMGDQIYAITKQGRESVAVEYHDHPRLAEFLGELNFSGFRDIGYDKLLLVEQRTDIKTFLELLRVVDLDHRTLVLSLGGSDFINGECKDELCEVLSICPDVYSIIDSEKMTKDDPAILTRTAFKSLCQKLAVPCLMLERRAIENYFTDKAVSTAKGADYKALHPFQQLSELSPTWEKAENWRIARNMSKEELMGTDLGNFLEAMKVETKGKKLRSAAKV